MVEQYQRNDYNVKQCIFKRDWGIMNDLEFGVGLIIAFVFGWLGRMLYIAIINSGVGSNMSRHTTQPQRQTIVYSTKFPRLVVAGKDQVFCPRCGKSTDETGTFCQWCGWDLNES